MMIWGLQIKGLVATGLLAAFGVIVMLEGFGYHKKWLHRLGWVIIGGIFWIPFTAVLLSVLMSRLGWPWPV